MITIKQLSEKIKDNLALVLLLPALLGGLWQLLELSKMSISFIRFFSPSQLLPDGLLMLFIIAMLYLAYKVGTFHGGKINLKRKILGIKDKKPPSFIHYFIKINQTSELKFVDNPIYRKSIIGLHLVVILLAFLVILYVSNIYHGEVTNKFRFLSFVAWFIMIIMFGRLIFESFIVLIIHLIESNFFNKTKDYIYQKPVLKELISMPIKIIGGVFIILAFFLPIVLASFFHKNFFLPENLKNLEYINSTLQSKEYNTSEISYFNDKYIFIEHKNDDKNITIEIIKFDELFNKE